TIVALACLHEDKITVVVEQGHSVLVVWSKLTDLSDEIHIPEKLPNVRYAASGVGLAIGRNSSTAVSKNVGVHSTVLYLSLENFPKNCGAVVTYIIPAWEDSRHMHNTVVISWCESTEPGLSNSSIVGDTSVDASGI